MAVIVFALTTIIPNDLEALSMYLGTTRPLLEGAGLEIFQGYEISDTIVGEKLPEMATIVRYPDRGAVDKVFQSAEYHALKEIRERAFLSYQIGIVDAEG
ncbi:DUF1330 domain-containing protein [Leisingera aquaemixtae]|uniref:DUF1330 domain-containing protein n=1 Tax=Leisingera aquaemixtae TaxID=1396826 RepID=A0ABY5WIR2_9RHOB|nr:DUF1330 domain-containing protein [Leisingera aquaemixtae]UWQ41284.1 DUF1330 domain-containing protein [Leisingera aquaemixtae]